MHLPSAHWGNSEIVVLPQTIINKVVTGFHHVYFPWIYSQPSLSMGSASVIQQTADEKYLEKNIQKFPKSKTWICQIPATIYVVFPLY